MHKLTITPAIFIHRPLTVLQSRQYEASMGHITVFRTMPPAHTLLRRVNWKCLRPHSAGSTLPRLWPTGSSALLDYSLVLLLKPFRPHLAMGALPSGLFNPAPE